MDFEEGSKRLRLRSVNPGYGVEDVVRYSGCELIIPANVPTTSPPTDLELLLLRTQIDRRGTLRKFELTIG